MAKPVLPKQLSQPERFHGKRYRYADALELLEDVKRLRRATGWTIEHRVEKSKFSFLATDGTHLVSLEIDAYWISKDLWSVHHGGDPKVDELRHKFLDNPNRGMAELAQEMNQIPKDP